MTNNLSNTTFLLILICMLAAGCKKEESRTEVEIPQSIRDFYFFPEGTRWIYQQQDDSTRLDTLVLTKLSPVRAFLGDETGLPSFEPASEPGLILSVTEAEIDHPYSPGKFGPIQMGFSGPYGEGERAGQWELGTGFGSGQGSLLVYDANSNQYLDDWNGSIRLAETVSTPMGIFENTFYFETDFVAGNPDSTEERITGIYIAPQTGIVRMDLQKSPLSTDIVPLELFAR